MPDRELQCLFQEAPRPATKSCDLCGGFNERQDNNQGAWYKRKSDGCYCENEAAELICSVQRNRIHIFCIYCTAKLKGLNGNRTIARKSKKSNLDLFPQAQCGNDCKG